MLFVPKRHFLAELAPATVAIQGQRGSFSHGVIKAIFNECSIEHFNTFEQPFEAVKSGKADLAVIPVQNTIAGHVPYVHQLIRKYGLHIVGEYFLPVKMCLLTVPGADLNKITKVYSHVHALNQCKKFFEDHRQFERTIHDDTGGAAEMIAQMGDPTQAAIASAFAGRLYGLDIAMSGIQDAQNNITRFLVLSPEKIPYPDHISEANYVTAFLLKPNPNNPWALADMLDILRDKKIRHTIPLEYTGDYLVTDDLYVELFGHIDDDNIKSAINTIYTKGSIASAVTQRRILGCFRAHHYRRFGRAPHPGNYLIGQ